MSHSRPLSSLPSRRSCLRALLLPLLLCAPAACVSRTLMPPVPAAPFDLTIDSVTSGAYAGTSVPLHARLAVSTPDVAPMDGRITWASSDPATAWVSDDGILFFERAGRVTITASTGVVSASRQFVVTAPNVERVTVAPDAAALLASSPAAGDTLSLGAQAVGTRGVLRDARMRYGIGIRGQAARVATLDSAGRFAADRAGSYPLLAVLGAAGVRIDVPVITDGAPATQRTMELPRRERGGGGGAAADAVRDIDIDQPGDWAPYTGSAIPLVARVRTRDDAAAAPPVRWSTSDESVGWVDDAGVVHFLRRGSVTIAATAGSRRATRDFDVRDPQVARVLLRSTSSSGRATPRLGERVQLETDAWQLGGARLRNYRAEYGVWAGTRAATAPAVTIDEAGGFVASAPGTYVVLSVVSGRASSLVVTVAAPQ